MILFHKNTAGCFAGGIFYVLKSVAYLSLQEAFWSAV